ncbi:MAG: hypothetical protein LUE61_00060 [Clostridiales bacterium]|nr:hypothetical protein [Clostridiales bacterium]MCD8190570.1 hypothetical protein [Clostridiales bacterium]
MKSQGRLIAICAVLFAACNIVAFAVPFPKTATFWVSDAFVLFSLLFFLVVDRVAFQDAKTTKSKFYGYPVLRIGIFYVCATLIAAILFILLSFGVPQIQVWIPIVVFVLLTGAAAVGHITSSSARDYVESYDDKIAANTGFMRQFRGEILALIEQAGDEALKRELQELAEKIRYSDSVSSAATTEAEQDLAALETSLKSAIRGRDNASAMALCEKMAKDLAARNALCKANKGH